MVRQPEDPVTDTKDVGALLEAALKSAGITQYELAKRLAGIRETHLGSQDQAIRRMRKLGQTPTEDVARDLVEAFKPELVLAADYFVSARPHAGDARQAALDALDEVAQLREKVSDLEVEVERLRRAIGARRRKASS